jgi:tetratricopeptide (TPR) repeat protein
MPVIRAAFALAACALLAAPRAFAEPRTDAAAAADPDYWLGRADREIQTLESRAGTDSLRRAEALSLNPEQAVRLATLYENVKEYGRAADVARRLVAMKGQAKIASQWLLLADAAAYAGRRAEAEDAIVKSFAANPSQTDLDTAAYLALYLEDSVLSLKASDRFVRGNPDDILHWIRRAKAAVGARDRKAAADALAAVDRLLANPTPETLSVYRGLKGLDAYDRAFWILSWAPARPDARPQPWEAEFRSSLSERMRRVVAQIEDAAAEDPELLPRAAMLYHAIGDEPRASAVMGRIGPSESTDFDFWIEIAQSRLKAGDRDGARKAVERAAGLSGDIPSRLERAAQLFIALKDCRAVELYRSLLAQDEKNFGRALGLAQADAACGDGAAALDATERALDLAGDDPSARARVAQLFVALKDCRAAGIYRSLLAADAENSGLLLGLAESSAQCGDGPAALAAAERALKLAGRDASARVRVAGIYSWLKDCRALGLYRSLLAEDSKNEGLLLDVAESTSRCGDRASALKAADRALSLAGDDASARFRVAGLYSLFKDCRASALYRSLAAADAGNPAPLLGLAESSARCGDRASALDAAERALSLAGADASARARAAALYFQFKDCRAVEIYRSLAAADPKDLAARLGLAESAAQCGDRAAALDAAASALSVSPEGDSSARARVAGVFVGLKDCRALELYRSLSAADPKNAGDLLGLAESAALCGDRAAALDAAERVLSVAGDDPAARTRVAGLFVDLKDCRAVVLYRSLAAADAKNPAYLLGLAESSALCGDGAAALDAADRALKVAGDDSAALTRVAGLFVGLKDCRAVGLYRSLAAAVPKKPSYLLGLAESFARCGDGAAALDAGLRVLAMPEAAPSEKARVAGLFVGLKDCRSVGIYRSLAAADAKNAGYLLDLAQSAAQCGDRAAALDAAERAASLAGDDAAARASVAGVFADMKDCRAVGIYRSLAAVDAKNSAYLLGLAKSAAQCGDRDSALDAAERALSLSGGDASARQRVAEIYSWFKDCRALELERPLAAADPKNAELLLGFAESAAQCGDGPAALDAAQRALALSGGDAPARKRVAGVYARLKDCRAVALLKALAAAEPRDAGLRADLGEAAIRCGSRDEGLADLKQAAPLTDDRDALSRVALAYQDAGALPEALDVYRRLARLFPKDAKVLSGEGVVQFLAGSPADAARSLEEALRLDPGLTQTYLTLGAVYTGQKRYDDALSLYARASAAGVADAEFAGEVARARGEVEALKKGASAP